MKTFKEFITEEEGGMANTVANVQGLQTEPVIRKKTQAKYFRRNIKHARKKNNQET